jgi:hypothetical protein
MRDVPITDRRQVEAALVRILTRAGIPCEALAQLVASCADTACDWADYRGELGADPVEVAAEINAGELLDQVRYILDECGLAVGEARIMELVWAQARAA